MTPFGDFSHDFGFFQDIPSELSIFFGLMILLFMIISALKLWRGGVKGSKYVSPDQIKVGTVIMKRKEVWNGFGRSKYSYLFYITFELDSGLRLELSVKERDYGMILEGDYGELIHQGPQLMEFNREKVLKNNSNTERTRSM